MSYESTGALYTGGRAIKPMVEGMQRHPGKMAAPAIVIEGGFVLDARSASGIKMNVPYTKVQTNSIAKSQVTFAMDTIYEKSTSLALKIEGGAVAGFGMPNQVLFRKDGAWGGPTSDGKWLPHYKRHTPRSPLGFGIPKHKLIYTPFTDGSKPFAKFQHPVDRTASGPRTWGIFLRIHDNVFTFTFKRIEQSWLGKLWRWIKDVVVQLIELVKDLYDFLKTMACPLAKMYLTHLGQIAEAGQATQLAEAQSFVAEMRAGAAKIGATSTLTVAEVQELQRGAPPGKAENLANAVTSTFCPRATGFTPHASASGTSSTVWLLFGLAGAAAVYFLVIKKGR